MSWVLGSCKARPSRTKEQLRQKPAVLRFGFDCLVSASHLLKCPAAAIECLYLLQPLILQTCKPIRAIPIHPSFAYMHNPQRDSTICMRRHFSSETVGRLSCFAFFCNNATHKHLAAFPCKVLYSKASMCGLCDWCEQVVLSTFLSSAVEHCHQIACWLALSPLTRQCEVTASMTMARKYGRCILCT